MIRLTYILLPCSLALRPLQVYGHRCRCITWQRIFFFLSFWCILVCYDSFLYFFFFRYANHALILALGNSFFCSRGKVKACGCWNAKKSMGSPQNYGLALEYHGTPAKILWNASTITWNASIFAWVASSKFCARLENRTNGKTTGKTPTKL